MGGQLFEKQYFPAIIRGIEPYVAVPIMKKPVIRGADLIAGARPGLKVVGAWVKVEWAKGLDNPFGGYVVNYQYNPLKCCI